MRKTELRQQDILKLIEGLDISPTMYKMQRINTRLLVHIYRSKG